MAEGFKISPKGLQALEDGYLSPEEELILEIMSRVPAISQQNCLDLANESTNMCGSAEAAVRAFRAGLFDLGRMQ